MIFCSASGSAAGAIGAAGASAEGDGEVSAFGGGAGAISTTVGAAGSGVARMREIGGRNDRVLTASPSARLGRGFFSSINDTVSMTGFGALGVSAAVAGDSACAFATAACDFRAASVCERGFVGAAAGAVVFAGEVVFAGASTLALFASLRFASTTTAALTGLRAVAGLRAAVLVVVLVGMCLPGKFQSAEHLLRGGRLLMNGLMDRARLRFVDGKNVHEILDRRVTQSFQIGKAGFHE